ncbi:SCO family protein [Solilutibacter pythonis]|nr:SCO family protein [Lysobacter pythonis]
MKSRFATLALAAAFAALTPAHAAPPLPGDSVYQLDAPTTDQDGRAATLAARRGQVQVVSMFYTSCRYICPLIIDSGLAIEKQLTPAEKARLGVVLVSLDPKRDTPEAMRRIAERRQLDTTRWALLRPRQEDVRAIAGVLGIRYRALADGEFNHTSELVLLDRDGRILARTAKVGSVPDPEFVRAVRRALAAR